MKTIRDYLDSLFLNVPTTPETKKAKEGFGCDHGRPLP